MNSLIRAIWFGFVVMLILGIQQPMLSLAAAQQVDDQVQPLVMDTVEMITVALDTIQDDVQRNEVDEQKEMMLRIIGGYRDSVSPTLKLRNHTSLAIQTDRVIVKLDAAIQRQDKAEILQQSQYAKKLLKQIRDSL